MIVTNTKTVSLTKAEVQAALTDWLRANNFAPKDDSVFTIELADSDYTNAQSNAVAATVKWNITD